ncbi:MAG: glutaminyl-peptide cyclotransferase [Bacteroidales bacterium]|nr:glutaminyl-peptide cyclotransferase [Bacteroidales bacterium]
MNFINKILLFSTSALCFSCGQSGQENKTQNQNIQQQPVVQEKNFSLKLSNLDENSIGKVADKFSLDIIKEKGVDFDSATVNADGKKIAALNSGELSLTIDTKDFRCGIVPLTVQVFKDGKSEYLSASVKLHSDIVPKRKTFKVVKTFNHDNQAYTQGLQYEDGVFYESTGLKKKSSLRKVKPETGEILQSFILEDEYFGEGLTIMDDKLVQLTWQNHKGFVYDKTSFEKIREFDVATEGWGLTYFNDTLYLTDGSENIYFLEKNNFSTVKYVQVYDNLGPVKMLNETEMIDGKLYANIYQSDLIAEIDYHTGKVLSYIELTNLLPQNLRTDNTDVLNGIAYDEKGNRLFVTGKNWPKLFQIQIIDQAK